MFYLELFRRLRATSVKPSHSKRAQGGFTYYVSDEQLYAFGRLGLLERLQWVEAARLFTLAARTPETAERQERLRRGEPIVAMDEPVRERTTD